MSELKMYKNNLGIHTNVYHVTNLNVPYGIIIVNVFKISKHVHNLTKHENINFVSNTAQYNMRCT